MRYTRRAMTSVVDVPTGLRPWREDLQSLVRQVADRRPTFFTALSDSQFFGAAQRLDRALPNLSPTQAATELSQLVSLIGLRAPSRGVPAVLADRASPRLPIRLYDFADGIFVTDAHGPHRQLVGKRVVAIADKPIEDIVAALDPLVARDDFQAPVRTLPLHLVSVGALYALGVMPRPAQTEITVARPNGRLEKRRLTAMSAPFYAQWTRRRLWGLPVRPATLRLRDPWTPLWHASLADPSILYIQVNRLAPSVDQPLQAIAAAASNDPPAATVIDLRSNGDPETAPYGPFFRQLAALLKHPPDHPVFVLVAGRGQRNIARHVAGNAVVVHENPPGPSPSLDAIRPIVLPNSGIAIHLSHRSWTRRPPAVPRPPKRPYTLKIRDFLTNNDPALAVVSAALR